MLRDKMEVGCGSADSTKTPIVIPLFMACRHGGHSTHQVTVHPSAVQSKSKKVSAIVMHVAEIAIMPIHAADCTGVGM